MTGLQPFTYDQIATHCRQESQTDVACPICGPDRCSPANRVRRVMRFYLFDDYATWNCARCNAHGGVHNAGAPMRAAPRSQASPRSPQKVAETPNRDIALGIWRQAMALNGSLGAAYFTVHRHVDLDSLDDLSHCLRWHPDRRMIVALMRDPITGDEPRHSSYSTQSRRRQT